MSDAAAPPSNSPSRSNSPPPKDTSTELSAPQTSESGPQSATDPADGAVAVAPKQRKKKIIKIIRKKRRPARAQIDPEAFETAEPPPQTGTTFNIWYNKWAGGDREGSVSRKASGRCSIAKDSGYTKADGSVGAFFCLFFARGLCPRGETCEYLHRLPVVTDMFTPNVDCFGRDKFSDYRDDMGGVGSFGRQNLTLYVGRIHQTPDIEDVVVKHFSEWGEIERIRILKDKGVAFVTYSTEPNAQFAKEAMAHQSLDHDEILNVRWATEDPDPRAKKRNAEAIERQAAEAIRSVLPKEYLASLGLALPEPSEGAKAIEGSEKKSVGGAPERKRLRQD